MTTAPAAASGERPERRRLARVLLGPRSESWWIRPSLLALLSTSGALYAGVFVDALLGGGR